MASIIFITFCFMDSFFTATLLAVMSLLFDLVNYIIKKINQSATTVYSKKV